MKNSAKLIYILLFIANFCIAQNIDSKLLLNETKSHLVNTEIKNKLVIVCALSNVSSQLDYLKELNRTVNVFQNAKLKDGSRGIIGIVFVSNIENQIAINKLALSNLKVILSDKKEISENEFSALISPNGNLLNKNISQEQIYSTVQSRITR